MVTFWQEKHLILDCAASARQSSNRTTKNKSNTAAIAKQKGDAAQLALAVLVAKANGIKVPEKTADKPTRAQLRTLLVAPKRTADRALLALKKDTLLHLTEWEVEGACSVVEEVDAVTAEAVQ